jgi:hypothetical protein
MAPRQAEAARASGTDLVERVGDLGPQVAVVVSAGQLAPHHVTGGGGNQQHQELFHGLLQMGATDRRRIGGARRT